MCSLLRRGSSEALTAPGCFSTELSFVSRYVVMYAHKESGCKAQKHSLYFQRLPLLEGSPSHAPSAEICGHLLAQLLQKWWEGDSSSHSNASSHCSVPGHTALFANAKPIWDVELEHGVSGLSWQHSFLLEGQLSTWLASQKKRILDFSWTKCCKHMITINFSTDCMEKHTIKQSMSQM